MWFAAVSNLVQKMAFWGSCFRPGSQAKSPAAVSGRAGRRTAHGYQGSPALSMTILIYDRYITRPDRTHAWRLEAINHALASKDAKRSTARPTILKNIGNFKAAPLTRVAQKLRRLANRKI